MEFLYFFAILFVVVWVNSAFDVLGRKKSPDRLPDGDESASESQFLDRLAQDDGQPEEPSVGWLSWDEAREFAEEEGILGGEEGFPPEQEEDAELIPGANDSEDGEESRGEVVAPNECNTTIAEAVQAILAEDIIGGSRDSLIKSLVGTDHSFEMTVKRVERTIGMYSDPDYRDGRTVSGTISATAVDVSVQYPVVLNEEIDPGKPGSSLSVCGKVSSWDILRRQPTIRVEITQFRESQE